MKMLETEKMAPYTTFGIGGEARQLYIPGDIEELRRCVSAAAAGAEKIIPLGCGSNLLLSEGELPYSFVRPGEGFDYFEFDGTELIAGAATPLSVLASESSRRGLTGLQWAGGIPGTVGGAVAMNAGAFDSDISDTLKLIKFVTYEGQVNKTPAEELEFSYRTSPFPAEGLVTEVHFELNSGRADQARKRLEEYRRKRKSTQPLSQRSAGSVFKNPPEDSAGRLIEEAGLKGERKGEAAVSQKHANFIINCGGAGYADVLRLIGLVYERVDAEYDVRLEPEINIITGDNPEGSEIRMLEENFVIEGNG